jgi:tetratricopeptide (TPR) repeat protein
MNKWNPLAKWMSLSRLRHRFRFSGGASFRRLSNLFRPSKSVFAGFISYLFVQREWRYLVYGLPAILMIGFGASVHIVRQQPATQSRILKGYLSRGSQSLNAGQFRSALMWYEHAVQLEPRNSDVRLAYVNALSAVGELNTALSQFDELSRSSDLHISTQSAVAASRLIMQNLELFSDGRLSEPPLLLAEKYIRIAVKRLPEDPQFGVMLAEILVKSGRSKEALQHLETIAIDHREYYVTLSDIAFAAGMMEHSKEYASKAILFLENRLERTPHDVQLRCILARMQQQDGDYSLATQTLSQGMERADDEGKKLLTEILVVVTLAEYDSIAYAGFDRAIVARQIALLELMLKIKQGDLKVDARLCHFIGSHKDEGSRFEDELQRALTKSDSSQFLHLILGTYYAESGQTDKAFFHLDTASKTGVLSGVLLNNLAWVMIATKPDQMDEALRLSNAAIKLSPDHPGFLSTRGEIYFRMEEWDNARRDIEQSINRLPANSDLREKLAITYEHLGQPDLAAKHRELIGASPQPTVPNP